MREVFNSAPAHHGAQPRVHFARISSAVPGLPWSYTFSRGCETSNGIDPSPIQRKMTSRWAAWVSAALPSQEKEMAKETPLGKRKEQRTAEGEVDGTVAQGKEVGIEDKKSGGEKEMSP
ncbi:hypothetical protein PoB_004141500 [Plakobranchus ocellatus]|uniref:Uncharacterized protein n=1 Tax=Plakobranchus ocellatus TaxID=259542 RepID=A0AAV4B739_9GAST|nr:hypothetical protein PoB_004141500 [Plakobranchus ocellatus]